MKKMSFTILFIATQVIIAILIIYKQTRKIELSYKKQQLERKQSELVKKKENLVQKLYELKSHKSIKKFAQKKHMKKVKLSQIKTVTISKQS